MGKRHYYTAEEEDLIRKYYSTMSTPELAKMLGVSALSCFNKAAQMGLRKDPQWLYENLVENGRKNVKRLKDSQFKKGMTPHNKGKKISAETKAKMIASGTLFKKGQVPYNTQFDGAETIRKDKHGREYVFVRISKRKWIPKHVILWEEAHGKVPKGYNIVFKDNNTKNIILDNLEMISNAELMRRNSIHANYPPEVTKLIQLKGALKRQINKISKNE